jgi:hypothetical protein
LSRAGSLSGLRMAQMWVIRSHATWEANAVKVTPFWSRAAAWLDGLPRHCPRVYDNTIS